MHHSGLFVEPACEHNNCPDKMGCSSPKPGERTHPCAFQGSQSVLMPILDTAHLVHGTASCLQNGWGMLKAQSPGGSLSKLVFSMGLTEEDLMLGSESKLLQMIGHIVRRHHPPCVFVYATCATLFTMEDLNAVCEKAEQAWGISVIAVHNPGFAGGQNIGSRYAGEALFEKVIGTTTDVEDKESTPFDINLIGEYSFSQEMKEIEGLLSETGIRVVTRIGGDCSFDELRAAHLAKVNMLVGGRSMLNLARHMQDSFGIPFCEGSFCGSNEIRFSLRQLAYYFQDAELDDRLQRFMRKEEARVRKEISLTCKPLKGKKVVLFTEGAESWLYISALYELGLRITVIGTYSNAREDVSRIKERIKDDTLIITEIDEKSILELYEGRKADLMIVSGRSAYVPLKEKIPFLDIDGERRKTYTGYAGLRRMAEDLMDILEQPIWQMVRRRSPWEV
ncbi:nitrogenase component 1 [Paenibacillus sp. URB8-2]|uniref:nitrogenase component 1 n=1 Tax=Paenibacillus sp. URB8-2 TaxID=2741301 RepID=UPI0015BC6524|nr:nitrogenase component 1 [Paenibacillus sp. URB8-2]BCG60990.1 nitrogenase iron-molybdenum cofactor biosynthesis protein NifE [Paenibacillus sp. URB8-2]